MRTANLSVPLKVSYIFAPCVFHQNSIFDITCSWGNSSGLKAKHHIESRVKSLKGYWLIIYDMIYGSKTSGFGWDDQKNMVTTEPKVWASYLEVKVQNLLDMCN